MAHTNSATGRRRGLNRRFHRLRPCRSFLRYRTGCLLALIPLLTDRANPVEEVGADLLCLYPYNLQEEVWSDDFMIGRAASNQPNSGILVDQFVADVDVKRLRRIFGWQRPLWQEPPPLIEL